MGLSMNSTKGNLPVIDRIWGLEEMIFGERTFKSEKGSFTLYLEVDGHARMKVDCNRAHGSYRLRNNSLSFGPLAVTMAYCGDGSLHDQFLQLIEATHSYEVKDDRLILISLDGRLIFSPLG
jgi:heat shock protein HslJ